MKKLKNKFDRDCIVRILIPFRGPIEFEAVEGNGVFPIHGRILAFTDKNFIQEFEQIGYGFRMAHTTFYQYKELWNKEAKCYLSTRRKGRDYREVGRRGFFEK